MLIFGMACRQEWKELCDKMFPPKDDATAQRRKTKFVIDEQYRDEGEHGAWPIRCLVEHIPCCLCMICSTGL